MAALKIHYEGWVKLPTGLLRALGAKAGDTLEASPREDGLVLRAAAGNKRIPRDPRLDDQAPAASGAEDAPSAPKTPRAARPTQVAVALPPALRSAGRRRKVDAADEPAG
jgi:bifunctional DNA-binding transcriptional regulator/antitoxin component of YhaV-PrlF toxin-antitoxin module